MRPIEGKDYVIIHRNSEECNKALTCSFLHSIRHHYPRIGQSQKKVVLYDNAMKLIDTFDFLNNDNRAEIRFHKKHLKEPLTSDLAWRRLNTISARLNETILPKAKELIEIGYNDNKSHEDFCEILLQSILVS